ncbi:alpha/beta fold hydrolase [Sphingomonas sp. RHCKR7]|uniref:alpha/beta fold hydrolase n=1 Tax=Sphingomonas folli TaxID=2862497 RepID=UPI001CA58B73|nr:alpha/beta fold hydrolase [Sphingomonas folli]MBW6525747.1 alpha/beta fold hydrolase [Sphingomonas folli]
MATAAIDLGWAASGAGTRRPVAPAPAAYEPLVLLPGLLCDQALWRYQVEALADVASPMVADLTLDDTVEAMARRVLAVAPPLFSLAALSMGGYVALEIMRQAPERVRRLALIDTSARGDTPARTAQRQAGIDSLRRGAFVGVTRKLLGELVHPTHVDDGVGDAMRAMAQRVGKQAFLRQQHAIMCRPDGVAALPRIAVETLVVVGEGDRITPVEHARELAAAIPGATLHVLPDCGHMPALEEPERVSALLRAWLGSGGGERAH